MRYLVVTFIMILSSAIQAQTWKSLSKLDGGGGNFISPYGQFEINPYTNDIWFVSNDKASIIEDDGTVIIFLPNNELGSLYIGNPLKFVFTPNHVYYFKTDENLYSFDSYVSSLVLATIPDLINITSNEDTVYLATDNWVGVKKYTESGGIVQTNYFAQEFSVKGQFMYVHDIGVSDQIGYYYGANYDDFALINSDPDFLGGTVNDVKFTNNSDMFYVASQNGISYALNYGFVGNISSTNTTNMPSDNVLEIDFDPNDVLWATFGDVNGDAFAIAHLDGTNWVDIYDSGNSPINFSQYFGMAIDTLGNPYFCDLDNLHTIATATSPTWVGVDELTNNKLSVLVHPNPANDLVSVAFDDNDTYSVIVTDINGKLIKSYDDVHNELTINISSWKNGVYIIRSIDEKGSASNNKFIKQ
ncbi:MAG: T9SS type A sorting domain-containing protein [Crocinitomicaceae bacterium]|nr:T9SS type A sorting domain-containing protein [Crocinitomicaceae bacterium]